MVSTVLTKLQLRESYSHCHTVIRQLGFATRARDATSAILFVKIALREFDDIYVVPSLQNGLVCKIGALSLSALPCERDYSEPYSTPWAISPESVLPVGPSVVFSLIQYASVK